MSLRRAEELGLKFTTESMIKALYKCQYDDLEILYVREDHMWVVRWHYEPGEWKLPEDEWGAQTSGETLRSALEEAVHGVFFS